jgi:hypothetical protein
VPKLSTKSLSFKKQLFLFDSTQKTSGTMKTNSTQNKLIWTWKQLSPLQNFIPGPFFSKLKMSTEVKDDLVSTLSVGGRDYQFYDVASFGDDYRRLPFCLRVLVKKWTKTFYCNNLGTWWIQGSIIEPLCQIQVKYHDWQIELLLLTLESYDS